MYFTHTEQSSHVGSQQQTTFKVLQVLLLQSTHNYHSRADEHRLFNSRLVNTGV